ncbi:MAG: hypothetical protein VYC34_12680, partial [Planctomycetota bacterium]|nr:hypothetical protein [Planctomycetota bacterium]
QARVKEVVRADRVLVDDGTSEIILDLHDNAQRLKLAPGDIIAARGRFEITAVYPEMIFTDLVVVLRRAGEEPESEVTPENSEELPADRRKPEPLTPTEARGMTNDEQLVRVRGILHARLNNRELAFTDGVSYILAAFPAAENMPELTEGIEYIVEGVIDEKFDGVREIDAASIHPVNASVESIERESPPSPTEEARASLRNLLELGVLTSEEYARAVSRLPEPAPENPEPQPDKHNVDHSPSER